MTKVRRKWLCKGCGYTFKSENKQCPECGGGNLGDLTKLNMSSYWMCKCLIPIIALLVAGIAIIIGSLP